jgi:hypothetical protein
MVLSVYNYPKDHQSLFPPLIPHEDHELLEVGKVIHGLKDKYRQIRPWGIRGWESDSWS